MLGINAELCAFHYREGERSKGKCSLKRTQLHLVKKMVFTRVFIIGRKTLLTTMYLFLEKEKQSLQW